MKILFANCHRSIVGGAERYLASVFPRVRQSGYQVALLHTFTSRTGDTTIDGQHADVPIWRLQDNSAEKVLKEIANWRPDVVFGHGLEPFEVERELIEQYPFVAFIHNYSHTCPTGRKCHFSPAIEICTRKAGPVCLLLHYPRRCGGLHPARTWHDYRLQSQRLGMLPRYKQILVASQHMLAELMLHGANPQLISATKLPPTDFYPDPEPPVPRPVSGQLLMTGRLTDVKGAHQAIEAVELAARALNREIDLTIAGDGPERASVENRARLSSVSVNVTGWMGTADLLPLMRRSDLMLVPSIWPEPFGLVGIEAGCVGLPSVGFGLGGIRDWLIPGESGESAPADPPTSEGLAEAICRALRSTEHLSHLRRGCWKIARTYNMTDHLNDLHRVFAASVGVRPAELTE